MKVIQLAWIFALVSFPEILAAQKNLVLNNDLEDVNVCTEYQSPCSPAAWFAINQNNAAGFIHRSPSPAPSGKHYLRLISASSGSDHRQYWQTKLLCPVVLGQKYHVAMKGISRLESPKKDTIEISDLLFDINSSQLNDTDAINLIGERLRRAGYDTILIIGFTDSTGSASYNQALSLRRANNILSLLSSKYPIDNSKIVAVGGGVSYKYASPSKNRRVEVIFSEKARK
jgi:outer membrane protein OmpA-like peptidoglycan-associated protein